MGRKRKPIVPKPWVEPTSEGEWEPSSIPRHNFFAKRSRLEAEVQHHHHRDRVREFALDHDSEDPAEEVGVQEPQHEPDLSSEEDLLRTQQNIPQTIIHPPEPIVHITDEETENEDHEEGLDSVEDLIELESNQEVILIILLK